MLPCIESIVGLSFHSSFYLNLVCILSSNNFFVYTSREFLLLSILSLLFER
ncbi:protein of unknown function [Brevefilum fermentans]|uniref:Uncharacterized protein n=1 Tax=Candidatus Brevifilum fermentans TaxID=1986204 RepID=A0A1Y6K565_9CHLR|nr:protein of unknown function [Brevefilum fermentans]